MITKPVIWLKQKWLSMTLTQKCVLVAAPVTAVGLLLFIYGVITKEQMVGALLTIAISLVTAVLRALKKKEEQKQEEQRQEEQKIKQRAKKKKIGFVILAIVGAGLLFWALKK